MAQQDRKVCACDNITKTKQKESLTYRQDRRNLEFYINIAARSSDKAAPVSQALYLQAHMVISTTVNHILGQSCDFQMHLY